MQDKAAQIVLDHDEYPRPGTTVETLATLQPSFEALGAYRPDNGESFDEMALRVYPQAGMIQHDVDGRRIHLRQTGFPLSLKLRVGIVQEESHHADENRQCKPDKPVQTGRNLCIAHEVPSHSRTDDRCKFCRACLTGQ